jgi:hypothetical protein
MCTKNTHILLSMPRTMQLIIFEKAGPNEPCGLISYGTCEGRRNDISELTPLPPSIPPSLPPSLPPTPSNHPSGTYLLNEEVEAWVLDVREGSLLGFLAV